ncbi:S8/S53 family peptidase [Hymenobacter sp. DG25A]|uniref:S8/S53 family peptidase n=1 Tax=Hymenobacter sp. DG25A TaxID=1385663 RepID=UPI0009E841EB|nr:S8/S53 family peptidase [Hymenobacter sp. DG25A]
MFPPLRLLLLVLFLGSGLWLPLASLAQQARRTPATLPGVCVVRLKAPASARGIASTDLLQSSPLQKALQQLGATQPRQKYPKALLPRAGQARGVDLRQIYQVRYPAGVPFEKVRQQLLQTGAFEYVEPLYQRQPLYQPNDPFADSTRASNTARQYYLKNIRAYRAWDFSKGDSTIVIGISDTGMRFTHQDLKGKEKRNYADPIDGIDNDNDGYIDNFRGWDLADNDNDATADKLPGYGHGTLVAGVATANSDNGRGIAGVGFNCKYLPLKVYPSTPTGYFAGFESIVYAADHGCQVLNLSWGDVGGRSQYEQDIITYAAVNRNMVIVAAAGNTNADLDFYPASYDHVISVAGSDVNDRKGKNISFSHFVDLTAPSEAILTTSFDHDSAYSSGVWGSSFAAPMVAAAAGLVRLRFPEYNVEQVAAQLRQTTDSLYTITSNTIYRHKLGTGRLNIARALALTDRREARVVREDYLPARSYFQPGDTVRLTVQVQSLLNPIHGLTVSLTSLSPYLTVRNPTFPVPSLTTLALASNTENPFELIVSPETPMATTAVLRYHFVGDNGYQDDQYVKIVLNPGYVTLTAGDLDLSLTSQGNIGYEATNPSLGEGVTYRSNLPMLSIGGLVVATSSRRVSDRLPNAQGKIDTDFTSLSAVQLLKAPRRGTEEAAGLFADTLQNTRPITRAGVRVRQHAYAWAEPTERRNFIVLEYRLTNITPDTLKPLHAGLYMDWDLLPNPAGNEAAWDEERRLGYVTERKNPKHYAGVALLRGGAPSFYAADNAAPADSAVRIYNGFSDAEKFRMLSTGTRNRAAGQTATGADVSYMLGAKIPQLAPGDSVMVAFAVLAAGTLDSLLTASTTAQTWYDGIALPVRPAQTAQWQLYPNPTSGLLYVLVPAGFAAERVIVLDGVGRTVRQQSWSAHQTSATLQLQGLKPGVYIVQLQGKEAVLTRKVLVTHP